MKLLQFSAYCLALALVSTRAQGQVVRYRGTGPNARLQTAAQSDSVLQALNKRGTGFVFTREITRTITRPDTIIYECTFKGANAGVLQNRKKYAAFIGKPLPAFTLPDLAGKQLASASLAGQPVVINMWFTSCAPCIAEMPALNRIKAERASTDVVFLAMTFEDRKKVQAFLNKHPFTFRHLVGARQYCQQFTNDYPISIFVSRKGIITNILEGIPMKYAAAAQKDTDANDQEFLEALRRIE